MYPNLHASSFWTNPYILLLQRIPIWWRWYYWANPVAWSLYGLVASQFSDIETLVKLSNGVDMLQTRLLIKHVFGFRHEFISIAGIMVVGFCLLFAVIFAFAIKSFNFQRRWSNPSTLRSGPLLIIYKNCIL